MRGRHRPPRQVLLQESDGPPADNEFVGRWIGIAIAVGALVVLGLLALYVSMPRVAFEERDGKRTWIIYEGIRESGTTVKLSVEPDDAVVCKRGWAERGIDSVTSTEWVAEFYLEYGPASGIAEVHCGPASM